MSHINMVDYNYTYNNPSIYIDVMGLWYFDFDACIPIFPPFGPTFGVQGGNSGVGFYFGGGAMTGPSASCTFAPDDDVIPGGYWGFQIGYYLTGQGGSDINSPESVDPYYEGGLGTPGASGTAFYLWRVWTPNGNEGE